MRIAPTNWAVLFAASHKVEYKLNIDGVDYEGENLKGNPIISKPLMDKPAIGRVCSATMKAVIRPFAGVTIPKAARVYCYCRLVSPDGSISTPWLLQGCYFISSRTGKTNITFTMRDDMVKAGQTYFDKTAIQDWPRQQSDVAADIARIMGVEIDERSSFAIGSSYRVNYISNDTLISEILSFIAASNGGNWIMTEEGKLRLVQLASPSTNADMVLGKAHGGYSEAGVPLVISRVTMTDSNDETFSAGDDTGFELTFDNPFADQTVVDDVCNALSGVEYSPYRVDSARISPLLELGDTVTVTKKDGTSVNVILFAVDVSCNVGYTCTLEAQADRDAEDEFPFKTAAQLKDSRSIRAYKSYYGTSLNKAEGLVIRRIKDSREEAKVVFNADEMAFYQGGTQVLFFDPVNKTWEMSAEVKVMVEEEDGSSTELNVLAQGLSAQIKDANGKILTIETTIDGLTVTDEKGQTLISGGMISTDNLYLARLFSRDGTNSYVEMLDNGLNFVLGLQNTIGIGYHSADKPQPYIIFGAGTSPDTSSAGMVKKYPNGLWLGDSADREEVEITKGTGILIDTATKTIYKYNNGIGVELVDTSNVIAVFA